jgi:hypothetical protein
MPRVFIIPHHQDERLFSGVAALANESQGDFRFHALPPDANADTPLASPASDFREILSYLDRRKTSLAAAQTDLLVAFYDGLVQAREAGLSNLFLAGARYDEPTPCTAVVSLKFLSWEILEAKFDYNVQRHALLHLLVCSILGGYTEIEAHRETYGCLFDFNARLVDFNRKLARGYYLCSPNERDCLRRVQQTKYGNSIIQLCATLKHKHEQHGVRIHIGELKVEENYTVGQGVAGRHVHAHDMTFHQVSAQQLGHLDMRTLAVELASLRREMKQAATGPDHDIAIGEIAAAEAAAQKGDSGTVLRHLKDAGKWAFDVATKIGVSVASEAIKKSMGS